MTSNKAGGSTTQREKKSGAQSPCWTVARVRGGSNCLPTVFAADPMVTTECACFCPCQRVPERYLQEQHVNHGSTLRPITALPWFPNC